MIHQFSLAPLCEFQRNSTDRIARVEHMVDGVIRKITSALPAARPQPQIIRGTIDGSRRGTTNVFTPCNQSESMEPGRVNKFQFRPLVLRGSVLGQ